MKILITGAGGLLGSALFEHLVNQGEKVERYSRKNFSWQNHTANIEQLKEYDCVIHAAANTNVELCELDPVTCYKDNTLLTERLAFAASQAGCKFVYVSSTGIYGAEKVNNPYTEYDLVSPTTHYHRAKWLGEQAINKYINNGLIFRVGWIFGGKPDNPKNFVARRIEEVLKADTKQIRSNNQQKGNPTFVGDLSVSIYKFLINDEVGTYNLVNQGCASRFEYVSKIMEFSGLDVKVLPTSADLFNRKARVSDNETAISLKLQQLGYEPLPNWQERLKKYIQNNLNDWLKDEHKQ